MKGIVLVDKGLEEVAEKEIREKLKTKTEKKETVVIFETTEEDICRIAYTAQSIRRVGLLLAETKITKYEEENEKIFEEAINNANLKKLNKNLRVECEREGDHEFNSVDVTRTVSQILLKKGYEPSLKNAENVLFVYIYHDQTYLFLDYSGRDLSKRNYRIFVKASTLKGTLGYALLKIADYKPGENLLDPYCESGVIAIEAALMATKKPVNFYQKDLLFKKINPKYEKIIQEQDAAIKDKIKGIFAYDKILKNISNIKKNAKIAGVEKEINFSKTELEWLDTKFEEKSIDKIISKLPSISKKTNEKDIEKIYEEIFYQAEFILKEKGLLVICTLKNEELKTIAEKKGFKVKEEKEIYSGQQSYHVTVFIKRSAKSI